MDLAAGSDSSLSYPPFNAQPHPSPTGVDTEFDLVLASLFLSSEDDAIKTKTHIPLPVESFSQRLDDMVKDCTRRMRASAEEGGLDHAINDERSRLSYCCDYLCHYWGLKIASAIEDGAFR